MSKFRDKNLKSMAVTSLIRLLWVYLNRHGETSAGTALRRIDTFSQALFPRNRRGVIPEAINLDNFVQFVYIVCAKHLDHGIETLILPLMGLEHLMPAQTVGTSTLGNTSSLATAVSVSTTPTSLNTGGSLNISSVTSGLSNVTVATVATIPEEAGLTSFGMSSTPAAPSIIVGDAVVNPERMIVGLRSLLLILADIEEALANTSTPISTTSGSVIVEGRYTIAAPPFATRGIIGSNLSLDSLIKLRERANRISAVDINAHLPEAIRHRMGAAVREAVERVDDVLGKVAVALDGACGWVLLIDVLPFAGVQPRESSAVGALQNYPTRRSSFSGEALSNIPERSMIQVPDSLPPTQNPFGRDRQVLFDLMRVYIDCIPRLVPGGVNARRLIEMLCRYALHADDGVRGASVRALRRLASLRQDEARKNWTFGDEVEGLVGGIVKIAADVSIGIITDRFADVMVAMAYDGAETIVGATLGLYVELLDLWLKEVERETKRWPQREATSVVEEIEARGLFYLCSTSSSVRKLALRVLTLAEQFDLKFRNMNPNQPTQPAIHGVHRSLNYAAFIKSRRKSDQISTSELSASRMNRIIEDFGPELVRRHYHDPVLAASTRSEQSKQAALQRRERNGDSLRYLIASDNPEDAVVWTRCYPDLICRFCEYAAPKALQLCLKDATARFVALQPSVAVTAETPSNRSMTANSKYGAATERSKAGLAATEEMMEQWRLYLVFICASHEVGKMVLTTPPESILLAAVKPAEMGRTRSDPSLYPNRALNFAGSTNSLNAPSTVTTASGTATGVTGKHQSANTSLKHILSLVLPLLSCERVMVRQGIVAALGCLNWRSFKELLEDLQPYMKQVIDDMRSRLAAPTAQRKGSNATGNQGKRMERLRMELTHLLGLVANFAEHFQYRQSDGMMGHVLTFVSECMRFLSDAEVQSEWEHQMLRYYFAGLLDRLYNQLVTAVEKDEIMGESVHQHLPFETRLALFRLLEGWCGYGQFAGPTRDREAKMMLAVLDQVKDIRERGALTSTMEEQRKALEIAALKAMAALCRGPLKSPNLVSRHSRSPYSSNHHLDAFDLSSLTSWVDSLLSSPDEKLQFIARSALFALVDNNRKAEALIEHIVRQCYEGPATSNVTSGYFGVLAEVWSKIDAPVEERPRFIARIVCLALYKAADANANVRKAAIGLLNAVDKRLKGYRMMASNNVGLGGSIDSLMVNIHETYEEAAMASALPAIYKYAQAGLSVRLAQDYPNLTFEV